MADIMNTPNPLQAVKSAVRLTPLQLNGVKVDVQHTLLTPDYLEQIIKEESLQKAAKNSVENSVQNAVENSGKNAAENSAQNA